jgi:ribosomal protein S6--L-glutamate ligase
MRILLLSRSLKIHSTRRLHDAAIALGHEVVVADPARCYLDLSNKGPQVYFRNRALKNIDAVIPRIGSSITFYGTAILRQFEMKGICTLNSSNSVLQARDKLCALQMLSRAGIALPKTSFANSTKMTEHLIKLVGGAPLIVKLLEGTQGKGVVLCETTKAAESVIDAFREMDADFMVQEFIKEAGGADVRCFVIGDQVVASMQRQAKEGEFRSNLHRGGSATQIEISSQERQMAINAAKALNLQVAGVDILRAKSGACVIEVNSSPGLQGIEACTKIDVATQVIKHLELILKD